MNNKMLIKSVMLVLLTMLLILVSAPNSTSVCITEIIPDDPEILAGDTIQFSVGERCGTPSYIRWFIYSSDCTIGGNIDNTGLYTAANEPATCRETINVAARTTSTAFGGWTYVTVIPFTPEVTIHPASATMDLGNTQIFTASTHCNGIPLDGTYTWSVDGGTLDTVHGDTVLYTATEEGVYNLMVTDTANLDTTTATIEAYPGFCVLDILPDTLLRSRWIMLPAWIIIESNCSNINFDAATTVEFWYTASIFKMPKLVINNNHILQLLFIRPSWLVGVEYEFLEVWVRAGGEEAIGFLNIEMLPYLF